MAEFIDITEPRSPLGTENILRPYKRGEAEITVDVCTGVLRGTNFARSIRDMLGCVKKFRKRKCRNSARLSYPYFAGGNSLTTFWSWAQNSCGRRVRV